MRHMPTADKVSLNPNDRLAPGHGGFAKKQYSDVNQHYFHHSAVIPESVDAPLVGQRRQ